MSNIVTVDWLKENLNNDKVVIIDCRFSLMDKEYGKKKYELSHIKGAIRVDVETELSDKVLTHGGRHPLPSIEKLKELFENIGISNDSIVVAYDEGNLSGPSRLWWILKYLGHDEVYVLDGGIKDFEEAHGELTSKPTENIKKGHFEVNLREDMRVDMEYVKKRIDNKKVALVDCRESARYKGEIEPVDKKAGHIPNALNFFWMDIFNTDGEKLSIKSREELKNYYKDLNNYDEVIIYCGSGITASPVSLVLNEIGIDYKFYTGSFSDWISYDENPIDSI